MADAIRCRDACGAHVADMDEALAKAWTFLEISKGWRCPDCARELNRVNTQYTESDSGDNVQGF